MEQQRYTRQQFASKIKEKYPAYADMDDDALVDKITAKYPEYLDQIEGGKTNAVAGETATVAADQQSGLDSQSENGLLEQPVVEEPSKFWDAVKLYSDNNMLAAQGNQMGEVGVDMLDYIGDLYDTFQTGRKQAGASGETMDIMLGDSSPATIDRFRRATEKAQNAPVVESQQAWAEATEKYKKEGDGGFLAGLKAVIDNPQMAIDVSVSSMGMLTQTAIENPGIVGSSTAAGAAVGSAVPIIGTVSGGLGGFRLAASTAMEGTLTFSELLQEEMKDRGLSFKSNDDIAKILDDSDAISNMKLRATGRGLAI